MKSIKNTWRKVKSYGQVAGKSLKWVIVAYVLVSVAFTSLTITGKTHYIPFVEKASATQSLTPAGEMNYKEWREERAKWLITTDAFKEYVEKEALNVVDMKVNSEARASMNEAAYGTSTAPANPL